MPVHLDGSKRMAERRKNVKIDMNKDFEEAFPDEAMGGFTLKQCFIAGAGFVCAMAVAVALWYFAGMGIVESTYIGIPLMLPICGIGFYTYQKQTLIQLLKSMSYARKTRHLVYEAQELGKETSRCFCMERTAEVKKGRKKKKKGKENHHGGF